MARKPSFIRTPGRTSPDEGRGSQKETALQQGAQCQGKVAIMLSITKLLATGKLQLHITGQRFPQADEVVVIQPWFNLLAAAIWQSERDRGSIQTSLQDSREEDPQPMFAALSLRQPPRQCQYRNTASKLSGAAVASAKTAGAGRCSGSFGGDCVACGFGTLAPAGSRREEGESFGEFIAEHGSFVAVRRGVRALRGQSFQQAAVCGCSTLLVAAVKTGKCREHVQPLAEQLPGGLMSWFVRSRVKENRMQRERCAADFLRRRADAEALLRRREAAFARCEGRRGPVQRAQVAWLTHRTLAAWRSWLAAEKAERHFTQLMDELRQEEERFQNEQKELAAVQEGVAAEIRWLRRLCAARRLRQHVAAEQTLLWLERIDAWRLAQEALRSWLRFQLLTADVGIRVALIVFEQGLLSRSSFASQAAGRVQLTWHFAAQHDVLCALWAWHASAGKRRRTRQRLEPLSQWILCLVEISLSRSELEAKEAELSRYQAAARRAKLLSYGSWRSQHSSERRLGSRLSVWAMLPWGTLSGALGAVVEVPMLERPPAVAAGGVGSETRARSWQTPPLPSHAPRLVGLVQAQVARACGLERAEATEAASVHRHRTAAIIGGCWQSYQTWWLLQIVVSWHRAAQNCGHHCASEQLEQEMQSSLAEAARVRGQLDRQREALAAQSYLRKSERSQLEAELADTQQAPGFEAAQKWQEDFIASYETPHKSGTAGTGIADRGLATLELEAVSETGVEPSDVSVLPRQTADSQDLERELLEIQARLPVLNKSASEYRYHVIQVLPARFAMPGEWFFSTSCGAWPKKCSSRAGVPGVPTARKG
ncbi:hypothetical protein AK812_SmicGene36621 [Symbiodinium microadriaticum]|uniref:Uncharacterized protein n=1 Tax=Symbiodinium microadriaticum TaxID=2951 RepID=A0A1Q9CID4_SYMMI|nr:hypothetical protein AK812_SmicGene36621 [Symbiodinium microadriaticum]